MSVDYVVTSLNNTMFHFYKRSRLLFAVLMCFTATTLGTAEADITVLVRRPVMMADTATAGFVGVAAQGPFDQPVLIKSYSEFEAVFGAPGVKAVDRYLANAMEAFFFSRWTKVIRRACG